MKVVSRFEADLLHLLHFFLRRAPAEQARPLLGRGRAPPPCLSRGAVGLVQEALAKGTTLLLARGGWRRERHLRGERVVEGRLWERTPPQDLGLSFSAQALDFLVWVTAAGARRLKEFPWRPKLEDLTLGDQLLLFLAYAALRNEDAIADLGLPARPVFARHGLCRLAFPEAFGGLQGDVLPDFAPWTVGVGACTLEALQQELAGCWRQVEHGKRTIADYAQMRALGQSQEQVLTAYLQALEAAGRFDLARFLLQAAEQLLAEGATGALWVGGLQAVPGQRLADRAETYRAALAFLRQLGRLKAWASRARATGYFDEGYAAMQLWLADWERYHGDALHGRAGAVIRQLDLLKPHEGRP
jgi:hypothetical protein